MRTIDRNASPRNWGKGERKNMSNSNLTINAETIIDGLTIAQHRKLGHALRDASELLYEIAGSNDETISETIAFLDGIDAETIKAVGWALEVIHGRLSERFDEAYEGSTGKITPSDIYPPIGCR